MIPVPLKLELIPLSIPFLLGPQKIPGQKIFEIATSAATVFFCWESLRGILRAKSRWSPLGSGGDQLVVDCIHSSGSFLLYSKMLRGGKVFLFTKNLVNIRSEPHLFLDIAVPIIGENVDSDPNNYLAVV